jgi:hypothetical protein
MGWYGCKQMLPTIADWLCEIKPLRSSTFLILKSSLSWDCRVSPRSRAVAAQGPRPRLPHCARHQPGSRASESWRALSWQAAFRRTPMNRGVPRFRGCLLRRTRRLSERDLCPKSARQPPRAPYGPRMRHLRETSIDVRDADAARHHRHNHSELAT